MCEVSGASFRCRHQACCDWEPRHQQQAKSTLSGNRDRRRLERAERLIGGGGEQGGSGGGGRAQQQQPRQGEGDDEAELRRAMAVRGPTRKGARQDPTRG